MLVEDALIAKNGTISHTSQCFLCQEDFEWAAYIDKTAKSSTGKHACAVVSIEDALIVCGDNKWANISVSVECPYCGIRNTFKSIKWKVE